MELRPETNFESNESRLWTYKGYGQQWVSKCNLYQTVGFVDKLNVFASSPPLKCQSLSEECILGELFQNNLLSGETALPLAGDRGGEVMNNRKCNTGIRLIATANWVFFYSTGTPGKCVTSLHNDLKSFVCSPLAILTCNLVAYHGISLTIVPIILATNTTFFTLLP